MIVSHNLSAMNANRLYNLTTKKKASLAEKLSSGYKINRSADDAAGLAISEKMRRQIRGLRQGAENILDGINFSQVADGALNEVHDVLHRMTELSVQAANGTCTSEDREYIDKEIQQLKDGLQQIFNETEFNGKKIFRVPYVPNVTGQPDDIQVFTIANDGSGAAVYGGVEINSIRYTWSEMGIDFQPDGTFAGGEYSFETWDGERVELSTIKGEMPPSVSRNYIWEADNTGIYVNNVLAAEWDDMGIDPANVADGTYSFDYRGTTIEFVVEGAYDLDDVVAGINGDGGLSHVSWDAVLSHVDVERAATIVSGAQSKVLNTGNMDYLLAPDLGVQADDTGVRLVSATKTDYTEMEWKDFSDPNAAGSYSTSSNGGYPIIDWGLDEDSNVESDVTFDDTAIYTYTDAKTGFVIDYKLADEASLEGVKTGLTTEVDRSLNTPDTGKNVVFSSGTVEMEFDIPDFSFRFQNALGRDWDQNADAFDTNMTIAEDGDDYVFTLTVTGDNATETFLARVKKDEYEAALLAKDGGEVILSLDNQGGVIPSDNYEDSLVNVGYNDSILLKIKSSGSALDPSDADYLTKASQWLASAKQDVEDIINTKVNGNSLITSNGTPSVVMSATESPSRSLEANFAPRVNAPEKHMIIQCSSEVDDDLEMVWSPLTLSIVGLSQVNVLTQEAAGGALNSVKDALTIISTERSTFGAYQNRLEHAFNGNNNVAENTEAAESRIRDTDMAETMVDFANHDILMQAGQALLAQANQSNSGVLSLLQ